MIFHISSISVQADCRTCGGRFVDIQFEDPIEVITDVKSTIQDLEDAAEDELANLGWQMNRCPSCLEKVKEMRRRR